MQILASFQAFKNVSEAQTSDHTANILGNLFAIEVVGTPTSFVMNVLAQEDFTQDTYTQISGKNLSDSTLVTSITAQGLYYFPAAGLSRIKLDLVAIEGGEISVFTRLIQAGGDFSRVGGGSSGGGGTGDVTIVDNLLSTSTTSALSANQGRVLNSSITSLTSDLNVVVQEMSEATNAVAAMEIKVDNLDTKVASYDTSISSLQTTVTTLSNTDVNLQTQIDVLKESTSVRDVVTIYAELEALDVSKFTEGDVIKVLSDSNFAGATTYYKLNSSDTWEYYATLTDKGTVVTINGAEVAILSFTSDPQTQIDDITTTINNLDTTYATKLELDTKTDTTTTAALATEVSDLGTKVTTNEGDIATINATLSNAAMVDEENIFTERQTMTMGLELQSDLGICLTEDPTSSSAPCLTITAVTDTDSATTQTAKIENAGNIEINPNEGGILTYGGTEVATVDSIDSLKTSIEDINTTIGDLDTTYATKVELANKADTSVTDSLSTDVLNIDTRLTAAEKDIDNLESEITNIGSSITTLDDDVSDLKDDIATLTTADTNLQTQIDVLKESSSVRDVVTTYTELEALDVSKYVEGDVVKVLSDSNYSGATTYYKMNDASTWVYYATLTDKGTVVTIAGVEVTTLAFESSPQTQIDNLKTSVDTNTSEIATIQTSVTKLDESIASLDEDITTINTTLDTKQDTLVSGTNIKTLNYQDILGSGNLAVTAMFGLTINEDGDLIASYTNAADEPDISINNDGHLIFTFGDDTTTN